MSNAPDVFEAAKAVSSYSDLKRFKKKENKNKEKNKTKQKNKQKQKGLLKTASRVKRVSIIN